MKAGVLAGEIVFPSDNNFFLVIYNKCPLFTIPEGKNSEMSDNCTLNLVLPYILCSKETKCLLIP